MDLLDTSRKEIIIILDTTKLGIFKNSYNIFRIKKNVKKKKFENFYRPNLIKIHIKI